jgi:chromodomain-helicase-DNA-binding protein 7
LMSSYGNQMTASAPAVAPPQAPTYLPNSKQTPATQTHGNSPQYRAPFPQLSPQMSPRPQMSPHPQMSPRPVMSPAKPPTQAQNVQQASSNNMSPLLPGISSPSPRSQPTLPPIQTNVKSSIAPTSVGSVNTLQALEQMVMPQNTGMDYNQQSYRQMSSTANPLSPLGSRVTMSPSHQQHQQWPQHRSQINGNNHHSMMQMQQQIQPQQQQQSNAGQMMSQLPDLMSPSSQTIQVIPPQQQQPTYNYEELTQQQQPQQQQNQQQKSALDSLHKPYENLTSSLPTQASMTNNMMVQQQQQQIMSPVLQPIETQPQPQPPIQDNSYVSLQQQTNQSLETTDQSSDLNLLDSYSNSATINTSSMSSTAQKSSIDDSLLSQTTNDNSQNSHVSDNASNMLQTNNYEAPIEDNGGHSLDQELPCLEQTDTTDDFRKTTNVLDNDTLTQDLGVDKTDDIGLDFDQALKPKSADSTVIQKDLTSEMTDVVTDDVTNNVSYD